MKEIRPVVIRLGIMGLVATILGVMCIWYGVRRLTLPLKMTEIGLRELTLGRTTRRIEPKENDEIAEIARSFDRILDQIEKNNFHPNLNLQSTTKNKEKLEEIQRTVVDLKNHASDIEQTATALLTSVQSISSQTSSLPESAFHSPSTYTEHNTRILQAVNEIETEIYELQRILFVMKSDYEGENLPSVITSGFTDLEDRFFGILHIIKIIRKNEQDLEFEYI
jgi:methyl-accepting chemotaxis protein